MLEVPGRTCLLAAGPVACMPPRRLVRPALAGDAVPKRIVIVAGQHPGEDPAVDMAARIADRVAMGAIARAEVTVITIANETGWVRGHTRDTADGLDPNRCWHLTLSPGAASRHQALLAAADFVLDLHGDEYASRAYLAGPEPCPPTVEPSIAAFTAALWRCCPYLGTRPRAPGAGEDHPGLLVNWLAGQGVAAVMLELPMRLSMSRGVASVIRLERRQAAIAAAVLKALEVVAGPGHERGSTAP